MIRPELSQIPHDYHGAIDFAELAAWGIDPDNIIDFSVNSNPFGPTKAVREACQTVPIDRYPDKVCLALRGALSDHLKQPQENILVGNGTAELFWLLAFAVLRPSDQVLILGPTFGEYQRNARLVGGQIHMWRALPENEFAIVPAEIEKKLADLQPKVVHICNPNNPTGQIVQLSDLDRWASRYPETLFVIDEAYLQFVSGMASATTLGRENLLVLRSMTKDYGLAGLRLGYAVGAPALIQGMAGAQIPWSVNGMAQAAGLAALATHDETLLALNRLTQVAEQFRADLRAAGYQPSPSYTHYFLMAVGDGRVWREARLKEGMLVRLCESYGLDAYVRIATRLPEENRCLIDALAT